MDSTQRHLNGLILTERVELLASLHFILNYSYTRPENDQEAIERLLLQKPKFKDYVGNALEIIHQYFDE